MKVILESLIKRSILFLELKNANAPEIILQGEEKFLNEKINLLKSQIVAFSEELESSEIEELSRTSPCYNCKNATRELRGTEIKPLQCLKKHEMDDANIEERTDVGCSDYDKDTDCPNYTETRVKAIQQKYSEENLKEVLKFICNKLQSI